MLVFHIVFGKTVPDVSLNAVANLGYADCRFTAPVFAGDTLTARSEVIGGLQASGMSTNLGSLTDPTIGSGLLATAPIGAASQAPATDPLGGSNNMTCHNCGYKRDHDFAFCPQCATFF
jgi:hypothetical protein